MRKKIVKSVKNNVHSRDKWKCQKCKSIVSGGSIHAHHILAEMDGGSYEESNLASLCETCHREWHFVETISTISFDNWLNIPPYNALVVVYNSMGEAQRCLVDSALALYYSLPVDFRTNDRVKGLE